MKNVAILSLLLCLATPAAAQEESRPEEFRPPAEWTTPIEPFRIADGLHHVGSAELTAFLLTGEEGHVLIDAPMQENVELVLDNIRQLGFDPGDVQIQLASHGHFDHTGGIASLLAETGAELVLSGPAATLVGDGGRNDFFLGDAVPYAPARADRTLGHLDTVTLGSVELTAHLTPGHTRGCTSWSGEVTIAGEELSFVSICSLTVLPGYRLVGEGASYPGIAEDFCRSVEHLRSLEPDIFLASHASFMHLRDKREALAAGDARAFVDPEGYRRYLDRAAERIEGTLEEQGHVGGCETLLDR